MFLRTHATRRAGLLNFDLRSPYPNFFNSLSGFKFPASVIVPGETMFWSYLYFFEVWDFEEFRHLETPLLNRFLHAMLAIRWGFALRYLVLLTTNWHLGRYAVTRLGACN